MLKEQKQKYIPYKSSLGQTKLRMRQRLLPVQLRVVVVPLQEVLVQVLKQLQVAVKRPLQEALVQVLQKLDSVTPSYLSYLHGYITL
jgi:hypothetical protein